jgi:hypothetical protein
MPIIQLTSNNLLEQIRNICDSDQSCIVVLTSMDVNVRDEWARAIYMPRPQQVNASDKKTQYYWAHSMRVIRHIYKRLNKGVSDFDKIVINSAYNTIYGGTDVDDNESDEKDNDQEVEDDVSQVIIPVKNSKFLGDDFTVVFCEAQLLSQNLNQTELIRYGSGRLLDDVLTFIFEKGNCKYNRKLILIGDPYSLTYGKNTDSAICLETLAVKITNLPIYHYKDCISHTVDYGKDLLRTLLASSIEEQYFNNLHYDFDNNLINIARHSLEPLLTEWFSEPLSQDPLNAALFYKNDDCYLTNLWIKKHCLKNGAELAKGDLLIMNNNVTIPTDLPVEDPLKIYNGMYLTLLDIVGHEDKTIQVKTKGGIVNVSLVFTKIRVKCISIEGTPEKELFMLDNYFKGDELTKNEQIAFRVYCNVLLRDKIRKNRQSFRDTPFYRNMLNSDKYKKLSDNEQQAMEELINNLGVEKSQQKEVHTTSEVRNILRTYRQKWEMYLKKQIIDTDPYLNAAWLSYGWAITVHKSLGAYFNNIWLKGNQTANSGIFNESYYRWLYSGITAAHGTVRLSSPQFISPMMNCQIDDIEDYRDYTGGLYLVFPNDTIYNEEIIALNLQNVNFNTKVLLQKITKELSCIGFALNIVQIKGEYLTIAEYKSSTNASLIRILIDNKGKKDNYAVSNVRMDCGIDEDSKKLVNIIHRCASNEWPKGFREALYGSWKNELLQNNIEMALIKNQDWHDTIMLFDDNDEKVYAEVWYNSDGFITKIKIISKESPEVFHHFESIIIRQRDYAKESRQTL